ncbi:MAG: helix-hairpin-helix domain-containing protein [Planctomycetes bacterium]|nr:helix-hairpin-helix domain-containing protein [Planctomycetota bacterium]
MASEALLARLQAEFDSPPEAIAAVVALLEDQAPPAFIARYRRSQSRNMAEERIAAIADRLHFLAELEGRKQAIAQQAQEKGRMTPELEATLQSSVDQDLLDDLWQSMRPKRRTTGMQMEEKGLMPLAMAIQHRQLGGLTLQDAAKEYVSDEKALPNVEEVLSGVVWILAERIAGDPATRARFRDALRHGILRASAVSPERASAGGEFAEFFDFAEPIGRIGAGRMLTLRRAEREGILNLQLTLPDGKAREILHELHGQDLPEGSDLREFYNVVFDHAWTALLQEPCGKDVRRRMKEKADREAVRTYARNLRSQLMSPPLGSKKVLALRTSSKSVWAALLAEDSSVAQHQTLPLETDEQKKAAMDWMCQIVREQQPAAIAVPHGRRQAGSERVVDELKTALGETPLPMVVAVDEAASARFCTSQDGRKALPGLEVGVRTAVSLGRRLQDPLRELLRMDFRALGLGHVDDVHQGMLQRELDAMVTSCVAAIGTDLNTADKDALRYVPGMTAEAANAILDHRRKNGGFQNRAALREVAGLDERTWRHICGFLQIVGGTESLDRTTIHPEDYEIARAIAQKQGTTVEEQFGKNLRQFPFESLTGPDIDRMRVVNVAQAYGQVGRDPRGELTATFNAGVRAFTDLRSDLELRGRVTSLTEFGAFIDLGIGQDGLVHISQIPPSRLHAADNTLRVGEVITVWVLGTDAEKRKISLSMFEPRHLREGRQATLGERMEQQQGRGRRPARQEQQEQKPVFSRTARAPQSRKGKQRRAPLTQDGKPESRGAGAAAAESESYERLDRGRGPRGRGGVITVDSGREVAETRGHKGEITSLSGLRSLLAKKPESGS